MTAPPAPASRAPLRTVDPTAAVARTRPRTTITETVSQTLIMAWRALKKMRRNPEQLFDVTLQPLLFTAMFAYIFGGAISGNVHSYLPLLIPGIVAQTVLTTCMSTGVQLREDMEKGVFDRFKAMPMARIAPLAGPMVADLVRYLIAAGLTFRSLATTVTDTLEWFKQQSADRQVTLKAGLSPALEKELLARWNQHRT